MDPTWIEATTRSGWFAGHAWTDVLEVTTTTLDALVAKHGRPAFCKIVIEGFELEALNGLSQPIQAVSIEYAREFSDRATACLERLASLGRYLYDFLGDESGRLLRDTWVPSTSLPRDLDAMDDPLVWGDVYARIQA